MAITEAKLFSDSMQITRRQGNYDDSDGSIVDADSAIWISCLNIACQELFKDLCPIEGVKSGTTSSDTVGDYTVQEITIPSDFNAVKDIIFNNKLLNLISLNELTNNTSFGYCIHNGVIAINYPSPESYRMTYYPLWNDNLNVSYIGDKYYLSLLWQVIKQIYLFYEDIDGANVAAGMYERLKQNISGTAVTIINSGRSSRC